jgi:hypothetical protein
MEEKYVIKDFWSKKYYSGEFYGWNEEPYLAEYLDSIEDAKMIIQKYNDRGPYQIELVYIFKPN